ncbi:GerAB/ArcD/ProY family transporter [Priestia megaterium]|nr:GerAB/ArcD/ProY family transporter [Priestia megaterium]
MGTDAFVKGIYEEMLSNTKISEKQFIVLVILYIIGSAILVIPSILVSLAKQDAWITSLLTVGIALAIMPLYIALARRFPDKTLIEYTDDILGKWLGKGISLLFLTFPIVAGSLTLYNIGDFIHTQIMPETPILAIYLLVAGVSIIGVRLGIEVLARSGEILFPWVFFLFIMLVLLLNPEIKPENFQPVLGEGMKPVLKAIIHFLSFPFLDMVVFLMIFPHVKWNGTSGKPLYIATLLGGIFLTVIIALSIAVLGTDETSTRMFPTYLLAKNISVNDIITRIEVIVAIIWFISTFFKLSILFYVLNVGMAQLLNLKTYRYLTLPSGMLFLFFARVFVPNTAYLAEYTQKTSPFYTAIIGLLLPLVLLTVAMLKKKFKKSH